MHDLITQNLDMIAVFTNGGSENILKAIKEKVYEDYEPDIESLNGRKTIASKSNDIARSKTFLDNAGKQLKSEWQVKVNNVDKERKNIRDNLDALKVEVRKPLTDWEIEQVEKAAIKEAAERAKIAAEEKEKAKKEFEVQEKVRLEQEKVRNAQKDEAERLKTRREEIEQIAKKLRDSAALEATRIEAVAMEKQRVADDKIRAQQDEIERQRMEIEAEKQLIIDVANYKRNEEEAKRLSIELERKNAEKEREIEAALQKERVENEERRVEIRREIFEDLYVPDITIEQRHSIIEAIEAGKIRHVTINY